MDHVILFDHEVRKFFAERYATTTPKILNYYIKLFFVTIHSLVSFKYVIVHNSIQLNLKWYQSLVLPIF